MAAASNNYITEPATKKQGLWVFSMLWLLTFIVYLPTAKAGWVIDAAGWLYNIRHLSFWDYINNAQSRIPSLYQFTQFTTYVFYRLFNANPYAWHTLMVTLHAINAFLVYTICKRLFSDSGISNAKTIAIAGVVLYTICPHISEVIVWEASFHYLQGFLLILLILSQAQRFHYAQHAKYAVLAVALFTCSAFSLEVFYLTPWFILTLGLYYRFVLGYPASTFRRLLLYFFLPQLAVFGIQLLLLRMEYGAHFAHIAENVVQPLSSYLSKPPKYVFHILFFGRYFSSGTREKVYHICESVAGMAVFYGAVAIIVGYATLKFREFTATSKAAILLFLWMAISLFILLPLAFPHILLMFYDRYTYLLDAFTYMLLALLASNINSKYVRYALLVGYGCINLYFTIKVNLYWKHSTYIDNRLLRELPNPGNKTVILLNIPENMHGIAMIGAQPDDEYKGMRELFVGKTIPNKIWDAASYNMLTPDDGANVTVKNDSTIVVTLNQWGTWWWYEGHGAKTYATVDYKLNLTDPGHNYELVLKRPADSFLLLYSVGSIWKTVDMGKKGVEQY